MFEESLLHAIKTHTRVPSVVCDMIPGCMNRGSEYVASVPWRPDKKPSLSIRQMSDGVWIWRDWADSTAKGDVIALTRRLRNCKFPEAVRWLAGQLGIPLPQKPEVHMAQRQQLVPADERMEILAELYDHASLLDGEAREYLDKRGLSKAAADLAVRYYPSGKPERLLGNGGRYGLYTLELWVRKALPFLVYGGNVNGKWTAYRFRLLMATKEAQTLDLRATHCSPVSDGLTLPTTWPPIPAALPKEIVLVEGETDCLAVATILAHADGPPAFAILGTSGFSEHTEAFKRVAEQKPSVMLGFQRDEASARASKKITDSLKKHNITCRTLVPKDGSNDWAESVEMLIGYADSLDQVGAKMDDHSVSRISDALASRANAFAKGEIKSISLPWPSLSWSFGGTGIPPGTVGLLAALRGVGKTWASYHLVLHAAATVPCFVINTEMPEAAVGARLYAITAHDSKVTNLNNHELIQHCQAEHQRYIDSLPLGITAPEGRTPPGVLELVRDIARKYRLIVLDHLGDLDLQGRPSYEALPQLIRDLQQIARRTDAVIIAISHMRKSDSGADTLSYSKAMENLVDWSWSLRAFQSKIVTVSTACGSLDKQINRIMAIRKNRYGRADIDIAFSFDPETLSLHDEGTIITRNR